MPASAVDTDSCPFEPEIQQDELPRRIDLAFVDEVDAGNHFAAWQEPELVNNEVRAAFRSLR